MPRYLWCHRLVFARPAAAAAAALVIVCNTVAGQTARPTPSSSAKSYTASRTPDGHPDLTGTYDLTTITPVERPPSLRNRATLTDEEVARLEQQVNALTEQYFWLDHGARVTAINGQGRTSIVVDPPDGRIPPLKPEAAQKLSTFVPTSDVAGNTATDASAFDNPEQRPLHERCLIGFGQTAGPPALPDYFYNNLHQIVQTPDAVLILTEMIHDARIVRMNQPHVSPAIRKWLGDSVGRWDGETLVVDTTNFTDKTRYKGSSMDLHVVERFSRIDDKTLLYRFTVEDPVTWATPWTGEYTWPATNDPIYEYACHEGNYVLTNILKGARVREREAPAAAQ